MAFKIRGTFRFLSRIQNVRKREERYARLVLFRSGGYAMKTMKSGMKYSPVISSPEANPHSHTGALRKGIEFDVEMDRRQVIIGPAFRNVQNRRVNGRPIPQIINEGARVNVVRKTFAKGPEVRQNMLYRRRPFVELTMPKAIHAFKANMRNIQV